MTIKFNIINLCKAGSLYNSGMKVSYRSTCDIWKRGCLNISYSPNLFKRNKKGKQYYTITFIHRIVKLMILFLLLIRSRILRAK